MTSHEAKPAHDAGVQQEREQIAVRPILWTSVIVAVVFIASVVFAYVFLGRERARLLPSQPLVTPPNIGREVGIVDQTLIRTDRYGLRLFDEQRAALRTWGWIDRERGVARIPVEEAMRVVAGEAR